MVRAGHREGGRGATCDRGRTPVAKPLPGKVKPHPAALSENLQAGERPTPFGVV